MKKFYFFLTAAALFFTCATASAQFVNSSKGHASSASAEDIFNTFDVTYSPVTMNTEYDNESTSEDLKAVSLNWTQARVLSANMPLYVQYGLGVQYAWKTDSEKDDDYSYKSTFSFLTAKIPVNLLYNFSVPNTSVALMPFVGLNLQGHILGQNVYKETYDGETETRKYNYFDKEDMNDEPFSRVTVGWQIGAKVAFNKYLVGIAYEGPVTNLYKEGELKINTNQINISLGIKF